MSMLPDLQRLETVLGSSGTYLTLLARRDRRRDGAAEIDVEAGPVALVVRNEKPGSPG